MAKKKNNIHFEVSFLLKPGTRVQFTQPGNLNSIIIDTIQQVVIGYHHQKDEPIILYRMTATNYHMKESEFDILNDRPKQTKVQPVSVPVSTGRTKLTRVDKSKSSNVSVLPKRKVVSSKRNEKPDNRTVVKSTTRSTSTKKVSKHTTTSPLRAAKKRSR